MPVFYVYILKCTSRTTGAISLYTGSTNDLRSRFEQHRTGHGARYTHGKDLELLYFESFLARSPAMRRELEIKRLSPTQKWALIDAFQKRMQEAS